MGLKGQIQWRINFDVLLSVLYRFDYFLSLLLFVLLFLTFTGVCFVVRFRIFTSLKNIDVHFAAEQTV